MRPKGYWPVWAQGKSDVLGDATAVRLFVSSLPEFDSLIGQPSSQP
jgi:hypothetical protein